MILVLENVLTNARGIKCLETMQARLVSDICNAARDILLGITQSVDFSMDGANARRIVIRWCTMRRTRK
jgi:uncharacterized protein YjiS (DUF1127 family)